MVDAIKHDIHKRIVLRESPHANLCLLFLSYVYFVLNLDCASPSGYDPNWVQNNILVSHEIFHQLTTKC